MREQLQLRCKWVVKERHGDVWVPVLETHNVITNYGLTQLASVWSGNYVAPQWLAIDTYQGVLYAAVVAGGTSLVVTKAVDLSGDTQLWVSPGASYQELVTFTARTGPDGNGNYTYTLSTPLVSNHPLGDVVVRACSAADGLSSLISEAQFDSVGAPNQRMPVATGFSPASGQWTHQFYFTGTQALVSMNTLALMDSATIGQGNMHNHFVLGYVHTAGTDVEIDGTLTMTNN